MKSMTGYGRGECAQSGFKITVELSSVNRKQSEISVYLPHELEALESRIRDDINRRIARGRLTVKVSMHAANGSWPGRVKLNVALARAYAQSGAAEAAKREYQAVLALNPGRLAATSPAGYRA